MVFGVTVGNTITLEDNTSLFEDKTIESGKTLIINSNVTLLLGHHSTLTISDGATLELKGKIEGGTVTNNGSANFIYPGVSG